MGTFVPARRAMAGIVTLLWALGAAAPAARAFEFLDGSLEVHGYYEQQIRVLGRDFDTSDDFDLAQWYHVLNLEMDWAMAPDGWGPFDLVSAFARVETRFDCVWTRACGLFPSADAYGDRAGHLPGRASDAHRAGFTGTVFTGDTRPRHGIPRIPLDPVTGLFDPDGASSLEFHFKDFPIPGNPRRPAAFYNTPSIDDLFNVEGPDGLFATADDPAPFLFSPVLGDCKYAYRDERGPEGGIGTQNMVWNPDCYIQPLGNLRHKPNPFSELDPTPVLGGGVGSTELPARPRPLFAAAGPAPAHQAQGAFYPNKRLRELIREDEFDSFDQNFSQKELQWNYGASQQNEKNLKELYLDLELLDSSLWIRAGKQNIVWGKTELFRTTDQFNPQDIALATLPQLEESRIALWAVRAVYSMYEIGPFSDVRAELAFNFDQFEPNDLGRCGEPFAPFPVCNKTFGLLAHGLLGEALAGEIRPPDPWDDIRGLEVGARIEWRWRRFSFQLSDFYGYNDLPWIERNFVYERNVDPTTGRPRVAESRGSCMTGTEDACLIQATASNPDGLLYTPGGSGRLANHPDYANGDPATGGDVDDPARVAAFTATRQRVLIEHPANQQLFAVVCGTSIGFSNLDLGVCAQSVLNSNAIALAFPITQVVGGILRGNSGAKGFFQGLSEFAPNVSAPWFDLNGDGVVNTNDQPLVALTDEEVFDATIMNGGPPSISPTAVGSPFILLANNQATGIDAVLSPAQEALLGCGPFYGTSCDLHGIDLLNAEASAVIQSWPGFEGTSGDWSTYDPGADGLFGTGDDPGPAAQAAQPGTVGFSGAVPCARFEAGALRRLPGCRGPGDPGYDAAVDGVPPDAAIADAAFGASDIRTHPFTGQAFHSEMAALSWNAAMAFVALSGLGETLADKKARIDFFDPEDPLGEVFAATDPMGRERCSFRKPQLCSNIQAVYLVTGLQRNVLEAGGNSRFGRRDFIWHGGTSAVLRYEKRNVLGFSFDFAEDRTKSNWSVESSWVEGLPVENNDARDGISRVDTFNVTISVDRPTFINFLNPNRTFFFNTQWFFQYTKGYDDGFPTNGPLNVLFTFVAETGYFSDRLTPRLTTVYDFGSSSGAILTEVTYRYTATLSATVGVNLFAGREEPVPMARTPLVIENRAGRGAFRDYAENGVSAVRDRDEIFLRIRYTF